MVATGIDVTDDAALGGERLAAEERFRHLADHDGLTGLFNRRRFEEELERHVSHGLRYGMRGAVLLIDVDELKRTNDSGGHKLGDRVLTSRVAAVLAGAPARERRGGAHRRRRVRRPAPSRQAAVEVVGVGERSPMPCGPRSPGRRGRSAVSVGAAGVGETDESADEVADWRADAAMYGAKRGDLGRVRIVSEACASPVPRPCRSGVSRRAAEKLRGRRPCERGRRGRDRPRARRRRRRSGVTVDGRGVAPGAPRGARAQQARGRGVHGARHPWAADGGRPRRVARAGSTPSDASTPTPRGSSC